MLSESSTAVPKSLGATLVTEPPPLVLLQKQTASGDKEKPSPLRLSKKRIANGDKENCSLMQNKKKQITTLSDKNQRYMTLNTMHEEQIDILNNINLNLKQIASNINQLVNYFITKESTDNEFQNIQFLDDSFNVTD